MLYVKFVVTDGKRSRKSKARDEEQDKFVDFEDDNTQDSNQDTGKALPKSHTSSE